MNGVAAADVPALAFDGVRKRYGRVQALAGVTFDVRPGEYLGLVGVNGAGKTTLIKCLLDFCAADAGTIRIHGIPHAQTAARAGLAYLPERFVAPHFATGRDFLGFMASLYGAGFRWTALEEALAALDLEPVALTRPVRALSKGMAQKLGLLGCLLSGRPLLVLDEPFSGLDPKARALVKRHLLAAKGRQTLFFSTHLLGDVEAMCDRLAVLHGGRVAWIGRVTEFAGAFAAATLEDAYLRCVSSAVA